MKPVYSQQTKGKVAAGEFETVLYPSDGSHVGNRGVILAHGVTAKGSIFLDCANNPGHFGIANAIAAAGLACVAADLNNDAWANDTAVPGRITGARTVLANLGCATDKVLFVAVSMGNLTALRYAADNVGQVAAVVGLEPACDIEGIRSAGGSLQTSINTAWGMGAGTTAPANPLPSRAVPLRPGGATSRAAVAGLLLLRGHHSASVDDHRDAWGDRVQRVESAGLDQRGPRRRSARGDRSHRSRGVADRVRLGDLGILNPKREGRRRWRSTASRSRPGITTRRPQRRSTPPASPTLSNDASRGRGSNSPRRSTTRFPRRTLALSTSSSAERVGPMAATITHEFRGFAPDGRPLYDTHIESDEPFHAVATGPARGSVTLPDGTSYDVTPPVILVRDADHRGQVAHLIEVGHEESGVLNRPETPDQEAFTFTHDCSDECGALKVARPKRKGR